jgi:hypothetical protein
VALNSAAFESFLEGIGFTKLDAQSFKFQKTKEGEIGGNLHTIKETIEVLSKVATELQDKKDTQVHIEVKLADEEETKQQ